MPSFIELANVEFMCHNFFCLYSQINNGVYRSGFARSQEAYDTAVKDVFNGLDKVVIVIPNDALHSKKFT